MMRLLLNLSIFFLFLTFCGAGYVLVSGGCTHAMYAFLPMSFATFFSNCYLKFKKKVHA